MNKAFIFAGQGSQKEGMGKDLYEKSSVAREFFEQANDILGIRYTDLMFNSDELFLMDTRHTQLALLIYEVVLAKAQKELIPDCVAGHSLGEYSSLVYTGVISFEEGIELIKHRGEILHDAFETNPGAMGAVIGLPDEVVENIIAQVSEKTENRVYVANYNGPGQLVINGPRPAVKEACRRLKELGAKRALVLPMKASGHSPNNIKEAEKLNVFIDEITFNKPFCPIFQCADGLPHTDPEEIKINLKQHLIKPVQWTKITQGMTTHGVNEFYEIGPDDTLQKIVTRMCPDDLVTSIWNIDTYKNINPYKIELQ